MWDNTGIKSRYQFGYDSALKELTDWAERNPDSTDRKIWAACQKDFCLPRRMLTDECGQDGFPVDYYDRGHRAALQDLQGWAYMNRVRLLLGDACLNWADGFVLESFCNRFGPRTHEDVVASARRTLQANDIPVAALRSFRWRDGSLALYYVREDGTSEGITVLCEGGVYFGWEWYSDYGEELESLIDRELAAATAAGATERGRPRQTVVNKGGTDPESGPS